MESVPENPVAIETDSTQEIHHRYGLERVVASDPQEIIAKLNLQTFVDVMPRPERFAFDYDRDWQSDDVKQLASHRSALLDSIEQSGEILRP